MKTAGALRFPARRRRRFPAVPVLVAVGVALVAIGAGLAWRGSTTQEAAPRTAASRVTADAEGPDWSFVLGDPVVEVLHHRPGLTPADAVRTPAFGWDGVTMREARHDPALVRALRQFRTLTPLDLVRMEFGT